MSTIAHYQEDASAMGRIYYWKIALRIGELLPINGGGFKVTYYPNATNPMLLGTDLALLPRGRAVHSIYFETPSVASIFYAQLLHTLYEISRESAGPQKAGQSTCHTTAGYVR